ncbi:hypothetical protein TPR58_00010 [Sphingomonas sp. HF-S3]|uniref:Uncharacterized protein n=1 Tax=Sphingomonas rustica TaxID=3103142 RepID=A0ABV0B1N6_9SPHN
MNSSIPPSAPAGRFDRPVPSRRARNWRRWLVLGGIGLASWIILFAAWIGVAFLRGSTDRDAGAVALNLVLTCFIGTIGLIAMHRGLYRRFLHVDRRRAAGTVPSGESGPAFGLEPNGPLPRIDWPWMLRLRHAVLYAVGILTLLYAFAPYQNQLAILRFVTAHSAGRSSAGSLGVLLFGYLPMVALGMLAMLLTWRQMRRRDAGLLRPDETLLLEAETSWLFSYAAAFAMAVFLCRWAGSMIMAYL